MHPRHIAPLLAEALSDTPVVLVNGARQSGKSTLVQSLADPAGVARQYLTLDDAVVLSAARSDPAGFINGLRGPVILDEVQRVPDLFLAIKAAVDRQREPGRFLLTGSADVMLLPGIADSLAGRIEVLSLWPLSCAELADSPDLNRADALFTGDWSALAVPPCERDELVARLLAGGFPDAVVRTSQRRREAWFDSYVQAVLMRDVRELANIEQLTEVPNLLHLLATRSGPCSTWLKSRAVRACRKAHSSAILRCWKCSFWWCACHPGSATPASVWSKPPRCFCPTAVCSIT